MITITTPNTEKITLKGTSIEIASVFSRVSFSAPSDGKTIIVELDFYESETTYNNGDSTIEIEGVEGFKTYAQIYDLSNGDDPETWKAQTIAVAHDEVKAYLDALGYLATISGI
jgi:hypothetical protein